MNTKRKVLTVLILLIGICAWGQGYTVETVPSPKVHGQDIYVSNPDGVLQDSTERSLNKMLAQLQKQTEVEMAVVAIDEMSREQAYSAHSFAHHLFNQWGIGSAEKNTGVLLLLVRNSRDIQIITGDGIAGILTDAKCGEILDNNIAYLAANNFDEGLLHICSDFSNLLMQRDNNAELMLGWRPKSNNKTHTYILLYFIVGFLLLILLGYFGEKKLYSGKPGETVKELGEKTEGMQTGIGCLAWLFPLPLLFYYLYYVKARKHLKMKPLLCANCGHDMALLDTNDPSRQLTEQQQFEEQKNVSTFNVWKCPDCGNVEIKKYQGDNKTKYYLCPHCQTKAGKYVSTKVTLKPTFERTGTQIYYYTCEFCGKKFERNIVLPMMQHNDSSYNSSRDSDRDSDRDSYSSSYSRSSSSSPGSWGGGRSSGGGAGRKF